MSNSVDSAGPTDAAIEAAVLQIVQQRGPQSSACPSEVARALAPGNWRPLMPAVRDAAGRLAMEGKINITQSGKPILPGGSWKGPIRLALPDREPD